MITIITTQHALHDPDALGPMPHGRRYLDVSARAENLLMAIRERNLPTAAAPDHGIAPIAAVHDAGYLKFLSTCFQRWQEGGGEGNVLCAWAYAVRPMLRVPQDVMGQAGYYLSGASSSLVAGTWAAAVASAHVAVEGAARILAGAREAYALCRPSGHHAYADLAGGFCYLNNAAIAARHFATNGLRPAILDIDVHHGNGTQGIFYETDDVFFCSVHEDPAVNYPFYAGYADETGGGPGQGATLNLPLPSGTGDAAWLAAIERGLTAIAFAKSNVLVVSLGFDAADGDPTASLHVTAAGFTAAGRLIAEAGLPTLLVQEGGYLVDALGRNLHAFLDGFLPPR